MKKILIVLGTILAATAGRVITAESKVNIMKEEQSQNEEIATGKEQKSEDEEIDLKKLMLYSYLLQIIENNNGTKTCIFCEYFLLTFVYSLNIDDAITNSVTKEKVKEFLEKMCTKIPSSLEGECAEFVDIGNAVVANIVWGIDPSQICPMLFICPSEVSLNVWDKASKFITKKEDKAICNICLLALSRIYNVINKTEAYIETELYKVCNDLPHVLTDKCIDFVKTYTEKLAEMFADLSPLKVCIHLYLCDPHPKRNNIAEKDGKILTNEIPEYPLHIVQSTNILVNSRCIICEFAMQYINKAISNKTRDRIEKVVYAVCNHLPKTVAKDCNKFVDDYADAIINILSQEVSPKEACTLLGLCKVSMMQIRESVSE